MRYFSESEFRGHLHFMNPKLLEVMDRFRALWGAPVFISPNAAALGRWLGDKNTSQHNVDRWGMCNAVDLFPAGMFTTEACDRAVECAQIAGATGIGIYTDTKPHHMIHIDVRTDRTPDSPATWGRKHGRYVALAEVLKGEDVA